MSMIRQINMTEESDRLLRFGVHTLPVSGQTKRSAMLVGGATFSYGSTINGSNDPCRNSPAVTSQPVQAEDVNLEKALPVFTGEGGLPSNGIDSIISSYGPGVYKDDGHQSEAHVNYKESSTRWKCVKRKHCLIVFLLAGISFCLTCTYMVLEIKPGNTQLTTPVYDGDTVLLSSVNTFWYNEVVIYKENDYAEGDHLIQLYSVLCNKLVVHQQSFHFKPTIRHATENVIIVEPTYFVANSVVNITITVLNVSSPAICVELYIFDDVSKYYPFKEENTEKSDTVLHEIVRTAGDSPVTTQVFFTIPKTSYYFFGLNTSAALTFRYSYEYLQLFYNNSDYTPPSCTLGNTNICSLSLLPSAAINPTQTCILGYAAPCTDYASPIYLDIEVNRNLWNPLIITFLGLSIVAWLITCNICFCLCCCVCARAGGKHNYVSINS